MKAKIRMVIESNKPTQQDMVDVVGEYIKDNDLTWDSLIAQLRDSYKLNEKKSLLYKAYDLAVEYFS